MTNAFQQQVYINPAIAMPGDFASSNPMNYKLSATGKMVADSAGVTIGAFAVLNAAGTVTSVPGVAPSSTTRIGFVHREQNGQITAFLADHGYVIAAGQPVSLWGSGDFFANADVVTATPSRGAQIWWDTLTGHTIVGAPASPPSTTVQTPYFLIDETVAVGQTITISSNNA
jgi:hypothetical protein